VFFYDTFCPFLTLTEVVTMNCDCMEKNV